MRAAATGLLIGVLLGGIVVGPVSQAQPAGDEMARARDLYKSAEAAMAAGRYADAISEFGVVYDITKDPVLFFKIGGAHEQAGKCDVALIYYSRYLKEGHPSASFVALTEQRIVACGGTIDHAPGDRGSASGSAAGSSATGSGAATGSGSGSGSGSATGSATGSASGSGATTASGSTSGSGSGSGSATGSGSGSGTGSAAGSAAGPAAGSALGPTLTPQPTSTRNNAAWLLVSGSLAFATIGAVLAYSAGSSENDIADLYVGLDGRPPAFDARTQRSYDDLLAEGHRYEVLSWVSFGIAGAAAAGAAVLFVRDRDRATEQQHARVVPVLTPRSAGIAVRF